MAQAVIQTMVLASILYLTDVLADHVVQFQTNSTDSNFRLQQIAISDDPKRDQQDLYVAGTNSLYHLTDQLVLLDEFRTGPKYDNLQCPPSDLDCAPGKVMADNEPRILDVNNYKKSLLFCGSVQQGLCSRHNLRNVARASEFDGRNVSNYAGGKFSSFGFFAPWQCYSYDSTGFFVATTYDGRPEKLFPKAVSSRLLRKSSDEYFLRLIGQNEELNKYSGIAIDALYRRSFIVDYIYGFEYNGFIYFLGVQKKDPDSEKPEYHTTLIRVCTCDTVYSSYTEVPLTCSGENEDYNVAEAAYFGKPGADLSKSFSKSDGKVLFVAFGKSPPGTRAADHSEGSMICMYDIGNIEKAFKDAQINCYRGFGVILKWIIKENTPSCHMDNGIAASIRNDDKFCGNSLNVAIGANIPITSDARVAIAEFITAIAVTNYSSPAGEGDFTVGVLGSDQGIMMKIIFDGTQTKPYAKVPIKGAEYIPIARDLALSRPGKNESVYFLSKNKVVKFPVHSCSIYNECSVCVTSGDPLKCGWCSDHCSTKQDCLNAGRLTSDWQLTSCKPVIYDFTPKAGPVLGGTKLTILGNVFGIDNDRPDTALTVLIGTIPCNVTHREFKKIICTTGAAERKGFFNLKVRIADRSRTVVTYDIEGEEFFMKSFFTYQVPEVNSISPIYGPKSGGTNITVMGSSLDIGTHLGVSIGSLNCYIIHVSENEIMCETAEWRNETAVTYVPSRRRRSVFERLQIKINIDNAIIVTGYYFNYTHDPEISDIFPRKSIIGGGQDITVVGKFLHVVQDPRLCASYLNMSSTDGKMERVTHMSHCHAQASGELMICPSPAISRAALGEVPEKSISIWFIMDGVESLKKLSKTQPSLSKIVYYPDPVYYPFGGKENLRYLEIDATHLELEGENLNLATGLGDILVSLGNYPCNVTGLEPTKLLCVPVNKPVSVSVNEPKRAVKVIVGNLLFDNIGYVMYVAGDSGPGMPIWAIALIIIAVISLVMLLVFCIWKHYRGMKMDNEIPTGGIRYTPGTVEGGQVRFGRLGSGEYKYVRAGEAAPSKKVDFDLDEVTRLLVDAVLIDKADLHLDQVIGQGHFGCVMKGYLMEDGEKVETPVAVKTLKSSAEEEQDIPGFLEEALIMKDFHHVNVLSLIGVCLDEDDCPLVVLPFMKHGDVLTYIRNDKNNPTVKDLIDFGIQIAEGMNYLSSLKFVHRDLAARNCMLDENMVVKVADFGLARDIYEQSYYKASDQKLRLPVKWMAIECFEKNEFSSKSDVWAFGIVMWELLTRGVTPYPEVDNWDILRYLKQGRRLPQPSFCPAPLYNTMLQCWSRLPTDRPVFERLAQDIRDIVTSLEEKQQNAAKTKETVYYNVPTTQDYIYHDHVDKV